VKKKWLSLFILLGLVLVLTGCQLNEPITSESEGIWNKFFVYPLSWLIVTVAEFFNNSWGYGLAIIVVTLLIRTAILPLMVNQIKSSKKMQLIQPELEELKKKYSSKDALTQQKLQQAQVNLMQKYDVNPLSGCLPILIQMPILLAFYHAIMRTAQLDGEVFLWFELNEVDYVLPIITAVTTFLQQKVMTRGQTQTPQLAMMLWMMPILIGFAAFAVPAALPLYWIVGNIYSIVQSYFIKTPEIAGLSKDATKSGGSGGKKK